MSADLLIKDQPDTQSSAEHTSRRRIALPMASTDGRPTKTRISEYIPGQQEAGVQLASLADMLHWAKNYAQSRSIWPLGYGLACCAIEMMASAQAHYDLARFGSEVFRSSPRQADLMIVAGTVSTKMAPRLKR